MRQSLCVYEHTKHYTFYEYLFSLMLKTSHHPLSILLWFNEREGEVAERNNRLQIPKFRNCNLLLLGLVSIKLYGCYNVQPYMRCAVSLDFHTWYCVRIAVVCGVVAFELLFQKVEHQADSLVGGNGKIDVASEVFGEFI